jgi:hypothetical protein
MTPPLKDGLDTPGVPADPNCDEDKSEDSKWIRPAEYCDMLKNPVKNP